MELFWYVLWLGGLPLSPRTRVVAHLTLYLSLSTKIQNILLNLYIVLRQTPQLAEETPGHIMRCDPPDGYVRGVANEHGDMYIYSPKFVTNTRKFRKVK